MKAWDTNLLVRHLTEDEPLQLETVRRELAKAERAGEPVWLGDVTLVETFWVLEQGYGLARRDVVSALLKLVADARFVFQSGADAKTALQRTGVKGDLPEHLVGLAARRAGAAKTQTFDREVKTFPEFEVLARRAACRA